jgi:hypothetical protein
MTLERLRDEIEAYLAQHQVGVLSTSGLAGTWAMPARYRSRGLEVDCLLPRWADVAYHLEQDPNVLLIVRDTQADALRWLECRGTARLVASPDWAWLLPEGAVKGYVVIRITPRRMDLVDEGRGWGARETLDL